MQDERNSLSEVLKVADEVEAALEQCHKGLLRTEEASKLFSKVIRDMEALLKPESTAFRIFDKMPKSAFWQVGIRHKYLAENECGNLERLHSTIASVIEEIEKDAPAATAIPSREPTGWERVDQGLEAARGALGRAKTEEEYQTVGLHCREILTSLAQTVFDVAEYATLDEPTPSETDAKRMLEAYAAKHLGGGRNEALRRQVKASLALANDLQHRRNATAVDAALCLEGTRALVRLIAIIAKGENADG